MSWSTILFIENIFWEVWYLEKICRKNYVIICVGILWACTVSTSLLYRLFQLMAMFVLMAHNWQKWKNSFLLHPRHEIFREEAVGLKSSYHTFKRYDFLWICEIWGNFMKIWYFVNNCSIQGSQPIREIREIREKYFTFFQSGKSQGIW